MRAIRCSQTSMGMVGGEPPPQGLTTKKRRSISGLRTCAAFTSNARCTPPEFIRGTPRQATFIKQANVAHDPQQVNNGPAPASAVSRAEKTKPDHPELLEHHHGERLDTGETSATSGADPIMETVGEVHRPKNTRRKSTGST